MSGCGHDYVMSIMYNSNNIPVVGNSSYNSGFNGIYFDTNEFYENGISVPESKYIDSYSYSNNYTKYYNRILGDATGEMGSFGDTSYQEIIRYSNSWYLDLGQFFNNDKSFISRGGAFVDGNIAGVFAFFPWEGVNLYNVSFRIILTP